ncbi:FolC bifunctional protein [Ceraceosorus guamensis]|uniref:tetrahydrofolate synthase n=1 Tax=Ceraceosorus guamensis TaxID=1522189 RepID=A0A316VPM5_9BASI|nr:FolC bifunctional protein [Ceraceosorus guamensis]PWN39028.1 FolC bifunctional protein [Ceraceosorus guamensis]
MPIRCPPSSLAFARTAQHILPLIELPSPPSSSTIHSHSHFSASSSLTTNRIVHPNSPLLAYNSPPRTMSTQAASTSSSTTTTTSSTSPISAATAPNQSRTRNRSSSEETRNAAAAAAAAAQDRSYASSIRALNTLQSNAAVIEAIRKSGGKMNELAIPEMQEYWKRLGYELEDLNKLNVIHITGTKGKGSTAAFCSSLLAHAPLLSSKATARPRVGLYTSPHLVYVRERIRIDGVPIQEELFAKYFWQVWDKLGQNDQRAHPATPLRPVYFRYLTLLAMHIFLQEGVGATILEVGIGGTYDSTNIVPRPIACGISSLGLDHTALLGNTLPEIARHKAGIFKKDVGAVSVWQPEDAAKVVEQTAAEVQTRSFVALPRDAPQQVRSIALGLPGLHQSTNAQLAVALVRLFIQASAQDAILLQERGWTFSFAPAADQLNRLDAPLEEWEVAGVERAAWPGRCQVVPPPPAPPSSSICDPPAASQASCCMPTFFLDGAHTTDSLKLATRWFVQASRFRETAAHRRADEVRGEEGDGARGEEEAKRWYLVFNCTHGRDAKELLGALCDAVREEEVRVSFDKVIFCTNTTYKEGKSSGDLTAGGLDAKEVEALTVQNELRRAWLDLRRDSAMRARAAVAGAKDAAEEEEEEEEEEILVLPSIEDALNACVAAAAARGQERGGSVFVTGSLLLVGGVMAHLQKWGALDEALNSVAGR